MFKLIGIAGFSLGSLYVASFLIHPNFKSFSSNLEFAPDFKVSYECKNYERLEGLDMQQDGDYVTVNYGGLGRRRGLKLFKCLS